MAEPGLDVVVVSARKEGEELTIAVSVSASGSPTITKGFYQSKCISKVCKL